MSLVKTYFEDFLSLVFPAICAGCGNSLYKHELTICAVCLHQLPKTNFHLEKDNPVAKHFWGKVEIEHASAFLHFEKGGLVQNLMHRFKYRNVPEIGTETGQVYGRELAASNTFLNCDVIVPVPLHKTKLRSRGYNQSEYFANGLSEALGIPTDFDNLWRAVKTESQTRKHAYDRYTNMSGIFQLKEPGVFAGKHVLVVDDVITTGSTLEACAALLLNAGARVSIVTMAYAK